MSTNIVTRHDTSPTLIGVSSFEIFAEATVGHDAELLKFQRGKFLIGKEGRPVNAADRFLAVLPGLRHGFVRWEDSRPTSRRMLLVAEHPLAPARNTLGDLDQETWPAGRDGSPADPWQFTFELPLVNIDTKTALLYATSSVGGRQALGRLARDYAQHARKRPGELPVIGLGSEPYKHKSFGNVENPTLLIFDWVADPGWSPSEASAEPTYAEELDDAIPF